MKTVELTEEEIDLLKDTLRNDIDDMKLDKKAHDDACIETSFGTMIAEAQSLLQKLETV